MPLICMNAHRYILQLSMVSQYVVDMNTFPWPFQGYFENNPNSWNYLQDQIHFRIITVVYLSDIAAWLFKRTKTNWTKIYIITMTITVAPRQSS